MAQNVDLEFRAGGSLFRDLEVMQAQVNGLGEAHKKVHEEIQGDLASSADSAKKFGASVSAASQLVVALAKSAGQGLPALAKSLAEVADLTEQARSGLSATDRTNLSNVNSALRGIADTQGLVVRQVSAEKKARIEALVEAKKITKEEAQLLEETTAVVDTLKEAAVATVELSGATEGAIELGATLAQQYRAAVLEAQRIGEEFGKNSPEFLEATQRAAELKKEIGDINDRIKALNPGDKLGAFTQFGNAVASGAQAVGGFFVAFAGGNQVLQETIFKFQSFLFAVQGLQGFVRDFQDAFENVKAVLGLTTAATEASTIASEVDAVAKGEQAVATTAVGTASAGATTGIRAFTASLLANPIFAAVAVLSALAGAMFLFANNTKEAKKSYAELLAEIQTAGTVRGLKAELENAQKLRDIEEERLINLSRVKAGQMTQEEADKQYAEAKRRREKDFNDDRIGALRARQKEEEAAAVEVQNAYDRLAKSSGASDKERLDALTFLGLQEGATAKEIEDAYTEAYNNRVESALQSAQEIANIDGETFANAAQRSQETIDREQAAAALRLRIREELAANIEAIEKELADKIKALEVEQADPSEQLKLRKAASDEEINNLERNLRREIALQELRVKVGDETFDKLTERQKQARADEIIAAGGGQLALEQQQQFNTLRLLNEQGYLKEVVALQRENDETLAELFADSQQRQLAELDRTLAERAEKLRKAKATDAEIEADAQRVTEDLQAKFASERLSLEEQTQIDLIEARQAGSRGNEAQERANQLELLAVKLEFAEKALALIKDTGRAEANAQIAAAKNTIAKLKAEIASVQSQVVPFSLFDLLGLKLTEAEKQQFNAALTSIKDSLASVIRSGIQARQTELDAQRSINEQLISDNQNRIQELESQLKEEEDLQRQGLANNVDAVRAAIAAKKAAEQEALAEKKRLQAEQRKLAKEQVVVDSLAQGSSLATGVANLVKTWSTLPFGLGLVAAFAQAGLIYSFFRGFKARLAAAEAQQFYKGTKSVQRLAGQATGIDTIPAMLTEDEAVIPVRNNRKHRGLVGAIIDDDFTKLRPADLQHLLDGIDLSEMLKGTGVRVNTRAIRQDIQVGAKASAPPPQVDVKGLEARLDALTAEVVALRKDAKNRPSTEVLPDGSIVTRKPGEVNIRRTT